MERLDWTNLYCLLNQTYFLFVFWRTMFLGTPSLTPSPWVHFSVETFLFVEVLLFTSECFLNFSGLAGLAENLGKIASKFFFWRCFTQILNTRALNTCGTTSVKNRWQKDKYQTEVPILIIFFFRKLFRRLAFPMMVFSGFFFPFLVDNSFATFSCKHETCLRNDVSSHWASGKQVIKSFRHLW